MLQYMKAFLAEEERRKRLGLPSQVPTRTTTEDDEVAATTEEEQSSDEEPLPKSAKSSIFTAINTADMARPSTVYVTPHGTSVMPPNILLMISLLTSRSVCGVLCVAVIPPGSAVLKVASPWIDLIADGAKTLEIRGSTTTKPPGTRGMRSR